MYSNDIIDHDNFSPRHVANGEILGVSLLMEDVLLSGQQNIVMSPDDSDGEEGEGVEVAGRSPSRPRSAASARSSLQSRPVSASNASSVKDTKEGERLRDVCLDSLCRIGKAERAYCSKSTPQSCIPASCPYLIGTVPHLTTKQRGGGGAILPCVPVLAKICL